MMANTAIFKFLNSPKLIPRKICVRENSCNFHTVVRKMISFHIFKVGTSDIWFQTLTTVNLDNDNGGDDNVSTDECSEEKRHIEKSFFFSVEDVQYNRDVSPMISFPNNNNVAERSPAHILTVTGAKGAWTQSNRDMAFSLYDSWRRAHILREQVRGSSLVQTVLPTHSLEIKGFLCHSDFT